MDPNTPESEWWSGTQLLEHCRPGVSAFLSDDGSEIADQFARALYAMTCFWPDRAGVDQFVVYGMEKGTVRFNLNMRRGVSPRTGKAGWMLQGGPGQEAA